MRRPVGVIVAAVLLGLISLLGTAISAAALGTLLFVQRPLIPRIAGVELSLYLMLAFELFCLWASVDLLRMRSWTRPAMVIVGGITFVLSGVLGAALEWARQFAAMLPPGQYTGEVQAGIMSVVTILFLIALLGAWWTVYFTRGHVKAAFSSARRAQEEGAGSERAAS